MRKLDIVLKEIESNIEFHDRVNTAVSLATVAWQLEHIMLVINNVVASIENSSPKDYTFKYKPIRFVIMTIGKIPRGKARAPKGVQPAEETGENQIPKEEQLRVQFAKAKLSIEKLAILDKNQFFAHPYFGNMKRNAAIRFLRIHSNHHLRIIGDILKA